MKIRVCVMLACLLATLLFSTCACGVERLKLATTTSVENSGLLAYLLPHFERECSCVVDVIAVGTGQALKAGSTGDVDLVMVHAPDLVEMFVADGHGVDRRTFMRNEFVIVGPPADPAAVGGTSDATRALSIIRERCIGEFYYCWSDSDRCWCGNEGCPVECNWGLVEAKGGPKPSYGAMKRAIKAGSRQ